MKEKLFKPSHSKVGEALANLAVTLEENGNLDEAETLFRRALMIYDTASATEDLVGGVTLFNLATLLCRRGRFAEAEPLCRRALDIFEKVRCPAHADIANTMGLLALVLEERGDLDGAKLLAGRSYERAVKTLGENHPATISTRNQLHRLMGQLTPVHSN